MFFTLILPPYWSSSSSPVILFFLHGPPSLLTPVLSWPFTGSDTPSVDSFLLSCSAQTSASAKLPWCFPHIAGYLRLSSDSAIAPDVHSLLSCSFIVKYKFLVWPNGRLLRIDRCALVSVGRLLLVGRCASIAVGRSVAVDQLLSVA